MGATRDRDVRTARTRGTDEPTGSEHFTGELILRRVLLLGAGLLLLTGLWGGLARFGVGIPGLHHAFQHGPLMVGGFLGMLIGLERAVGLDRTWAYLAPVACLTGAVLFSWGWTVTGGLGILVGSVLFLGITVALLHRQLALHTGFFVMCAVSWIVGNAAWLIEGSVPRAVPGWTFFLVLIIVGERLELTRVARLSSRSRIALIVFATMALVGIAAEVYADGTGWIVGGLSLAAMGLWLVTFDIARQTVRTSGQHRFSAVCLLLGYGWLIVGGGLWFLYGLQWIPGYGYGAALHAVFLGFVFSMIFAHAPIIAGVVQGVDVPYHPVYYVHLGLLHLTLVFRIAAGLWGWNGGRFWGGAGNTASIVLFIGVTAFFTLSVEKSGAGKS